tara:strand:- start:2702 stop:3982 length:1281 start_codon:yes stop_codon:yes gene_type:complete
MEHMKEITSMRKRWTNEPKRVLTKNQKSMITNNTGISPKWITKFNWDAVEDFKKLRGFSDQYYYQSYKDEAIVYTIAGLMCAILDKRISFDEKYIRQIFPKIKEKTYQELFTFYFSIFAHHMNDLNKKHNRPDKPIKQEKLREYLIEKTMEDGGGELIVFLKSWREMMTEEIKHNISTINDDELNQSIISFIEERGLPFKSRLNKNFTHFKNDESLELEFKESIFVSRDETEKEIKKLEDKLKKESEKEIKKLEGKLKNEKLKESNRSIDKLKNEKRIELNRSGDKRVLLDIMQTICSFLNTNGGEIFIGVADDKKIVGIKSILKIIQEDKKFKNNAKDGLIQKIRNQTREHFPKHPDLIDIDFQELPNKDELCRIIVKPSYSIRAYIEKTTPYTRNVESDQSMNPEDFQTYWMDRELKNKLPKLS